MSHTMPQVAEPPSHIEPQSPCAIELPPLPEHVKERVGAIDDVRFCGVALEEDVLVVHVVGGALSEVVETLELLVADEQRMSFHHDP